MIKLVLERNPEIFLEDCVLGRTRIHGKFNEKKKHRSMVRDEIFF